MSQNSPGCSSSSTPCPRAAASSCRSTSGSRADEVRYIVEHSGASVLLVDPELDESLRDVARAAPLRARRRERRRAAALRRRAAAVDDADEDATATINYTSGTTARPKGVAAHPPQPLDQRHDLRLAHRRRPTATCTCTRCRCSTATAGACRTRSPAMGGRQVVLRKVDGAEILRRDRRARRHAAWAARRRCVNIVLDAAARLAPARSPGAGRVRIVVRRRAAADAHDRAGRDRARLGVHADLRAHRDVAAAHAQPRAAPSATTLDADRAGASALGRAGRAGARRARCAIDDDGEVLARGNVVLGGLLGAARRRPPRRSSTAGSTPATAARSTTTATSRSPTARRT